jgi:hypothetical protein
MVRIADQGLPVKDKTHGLILSPFRKMNLGPEFGGEAAGRSGIQPGPLLGILVFDSGAGNKETRKHSLAKVLRSFKVNCLQMALWIPCANIPQISNSATTGARALRRSGDQRLLLGRLRNQGRR